jgi:hypothetical protein
VVERREEHDAFDRARPQWLNAGNRYLAGLTLRKASGRGRMCGR